MVRPGRLGMAVGQSVLDLPITEQHSLLDLWHEQAVALARDLDCSEVTVRVAVDAKSPSPRMPTRHSYVQMTIEQDDIGFRGTGGILRDLTSGYQDDDHILVASAAQVLRQPLFEVLATLSSVKADVAIISHTHGLPIGLMLIRCGVLREIKPIGFVDLKEQFLPSLAASHSVQVIERQHSPVLPTRTFRDYINAIRSTVCDDVNLDDPFAERWQPAFRIVEDGAEVHHSAVLHDSVVLKGAKIDRNSTVVRSVICPGAVVRRNEVVVDRLVSPLTSGAEGTDKI